MNEKHAIILFDGVCNLCNGLVRFIIDHDKKGYFKFASLQSDTAKKLFEQHSTNPFEMKMMLIENGKVYSKSDAGFRIFSKLDSPWNLISMFRFYPKFIRNGVYDFISRKRYAWFGKSEECEIPDASYADRFIS